MLAVHYRVPMHGSVPSEVLSPGPHDPSPLWQVSNLLCILMVINSNLLCILKVINSNLHYSIRSFINSNLLK